MPLPKSLAAYPDCQEALDRALDSSKGVKIKPDKSPWRLQLRLRYFITRVREENKKVYPPEHPMHGASPYDAMSIRVENGSVIIEKVSPENIKVEEL